MAIATTDGMPIRYYYISPISSTANSITLTIKADSVSGSINNAQVFVNLDTYFNNYYVDFSSVFTELGADWSILYITDGGTSIPVKVEKWDEVNNKARLWVIIPVLTSASKDIVLEFDNTVVTPNDLIADMTVSGMIIPTPDPTDDFYYQESPNLEYLYNMIIDTSNNEILFSSNSNNSVLYMLDEQPMLVKCNTNIGSEKTLYKMLSGDMFLGEADYSESYYVNTFNVPNCTFNESFDTLIRILEDAAGVPDYSFSILSGVTSDYSNQYAISTPVTWNGSTATIYIIRTTDGITWSLVHTYTQTNEPNYSSMLANLDSSIGGMFISRQLYFTYEHKIYTSSSDGITYTFRGYKPINFPEFDYSGNTNHKYGYDLLFSGTKLVSLMSVDDSGSAFDGEIVIAVFTNNGTTFSHHMIPPCLPEWDTNSWCTNNAWYDITYDIALTHESISDTIFGLFGNYFDKTSNNVSRIYLFKSSDWGVTWDLVSKIRPIEYYDFNFSIDTLTFNNSYINKIMQINNGYLTIISTDSIAMLNEGDSFVRRDGVFQFKLTDILDYPTGGNLTELDTLNVSPSALPISIAVSGSVAYVTGYTSNTITSINISDPENLLVMDTYSNSASLNQARAIAILGDVAYVLAGGSNSITSINISDPNNLVELDTLSSSFLITCIGIAISGTVAYGTGHNSDSIVAIDISDPNNLAELSSYSNNTILDGPQRLTISGNTAYIATNRVTNKIVMIDITNPNSISYINNYSSASIDNPFTIEVINDIAYVPCYDTGSLVSLDVSDPNNVFELDVLVLPSLTDAYAIKIVGSVAYIGCGGTGDSITSIDISDPENMFELDTYSNALSTDGVSAIDISNNVAYLACATISAITSIDIT